MGKWVMLLSFVIYLIIDILLFLFIPNGTLIFLATLIYIFWWTCFKEKTHYLLIPLLFFAVGFIFVALPILIMTGISRDVQFLYNMYNLIYPNGFDYVWSNHPPEIIVTTMAITVSLILFTKLMLSIVKHFWKVASKFNFLLSLSRLLTYIMFFYVLINLIPALIGSDVLEWFRSVFALSLFYDIMFVWLPFIVIYFLIEYIVDRYVRGKIE